MEVVIAMGELLGAPVRHADLPSDPTLVPHRPDQISHLQRLPCAHVDALLRKLTDRARCERIENVISRTHGRNDEAAIRTGADPVLIVLGLRLPVATLLRL